VPATETCCPGGHCLHTTHPSAFSNDAKVPLGQGAHSRSCVALPAFVTASPATQVVIATHAVAGSPS
jgi:hypothetical protein